MLVIAAQLGSPTFFVTMTCDLQWPEITSQLCPSQVYSDIPVVVCRVFKHRLALLEQYLQTMFLNAGGQVYIIHIVKFQKHELSHVHILIKYHSACINPKDIDHVISVEIPDDSEDAQLVLSHMRHKHPRPEMPASSYCQRINGEGERVCRFHYPHALQPITAINAEGQVKY